MDPQKTLSQAFEIIKLKEPAMQTVAKDANALQPALIIIVLGSIIGGLGSYFFPSSLGMVTYQPDIGGLVISMLTAALLSIFGLFLTGFLAERVFHSKLNTQGYVKVMGYANILSFLAIYPYLAIVSGIWTFVVFCYVLSKVGKLGAGSIILLILLLALIFFVVGSIVTAVMGGAGLGSVYGGISDY